MRRTATIHIELASPKMTETVFRALAPETKKPPISRSRVTLRARGRKLTLKVEAGDTAALRSTLNSYLRWVALARDTYEAAADSEKTRNRKTLN
jgi:KEOPS complex subunit Pcc1